MHNAASGKRGSYIEEDIEVKPSTELIPDEYEHIASKNSKQRIILHTFIGEDEEDKKNETKFLETIAPYGYTIKDSNRHSLDKDDLFKILDNIAAASDKDDAGLLLFFSGSVKNNGVLNTSCETNNSNIQNIWLTFDSHHCLLLKNKPKIFIFDLNVTEDQVQADSMRHTIPARYDTPAEADILVIYNKTKAHEYNDFTTQFCENIKEHAITEHVITLASCVDGLPPPIILSTLTRKFYFAASDLRGQPLIIDKHHKEMISSLNEINKTVANRLPEKKKKIGIFESFRKGIKSMSEPSSSKSSINKSTISNDSGASGNAPSGSTNASASAQARRPSGLQAPRNRGLSQSESETGRQNAKKSVDKKAPWKP